MRRARLTHFQAFLGFSSLTVAVATIVACEPDLDSLSASHGDPLSGGSGGKGGSGSGGSASDGGEPSVPDSCTDKDRDADESDVDCGGPSSCRRCDLNSVCTVNSDCAVGFCKDQRCTAPTCEDDLKNQNETDVDCGGTCAPDDRCADGKNCKENKDCESGFCSEEKCTTYCESGKKDGDETGVDCGGPKCGACETGQACVENSDCDTELCLDEFCVDPSCTDDIQNHGETETDCGGPCSESGIRCELGDNCEIGGDCDSYVCDDNECVPDDPYDPSDVLDTMEDGNPSIAELEERKGVWYRFGDGSGTQTFGIEAIPNGGRGSGSLFGMHTTAVGFKNWGGGVGFDLKQVGGAKTAYDASGYSGITFWAKAAAAMQMRVAFADAYTERTLGICDPMPEAGSSECDLHPNKTVSLTTDWKKYTVPFSPLDPDGSSSHDELLVDQLVSIQFRFGGGIDVDYWVDDIILIPVP